MLQLDLWSESQRPLARANRTLIAYQTDWRLFERWCSEQGVLALPAAGETLARYLSHLAANGRKASTIRRARISIAVIHSERGLRRPDSDDQVRTLEKEIARIDGAAEQSAPPLLLPDLERMMHALGNTRRDERDRALLLLGFAGAFRSCELVALDRHQIARTCYGFRVQVTMVSTDHYVEIRRSRNTLLCAVTAVERWLNRLPDRDGAVFRTVCGARVTGERLVPRAVSRAVQRAAARAQLTTEYTSSSLRSGLVASARTQGKSVRDIQVHGRWKDSRSLERYLPTALAPSVICR